MTERDQLPANSSRRKAKRDLFWFVVGSVILIVSLIWLAIPWNWAPVDDPGQVLAMRELTELYGGLEAIPHRVVELASGDFTSGVFRPLAWVYPAIMYQLPVQAAHLLRLLMVIWIILGPLVYFRRCGSGPFRLWMSFFLLSAGAVVLYQGLVLLSLQEIGGTALVATGLAVRKQWSRSTAFALAALFKGPFAWVLVADALLLWRQGRRGSSLASLLGGSAVLLLNVLWSRQGSNTSGYKTDPLDPELWRSASHLFEPPVLLLLLSLVWFLICTQSAPVRRPDFIFFFVAAVGYYLQMVPWSITAYYMGPIAFLFALALASTLPDTAPTNLRVGLIALLIPLMVSLALMFQGVGFAIGTNAVMKGSAECLSRVPRSNTLVVGDWLYVTSSMEGPIRIQENTRIFFPGWEGKVSLRSGEPEQSVEKSFDYVLVVGNREIHGLTAESPICTADNVSLFSADSWPREK